MFTNSLWNKQQASILPNIVNAPNGTLTADKLVPDTTSAQHRIFNQTTFTGEGVLSVYAKADGYNFLSLGRDGGVSGGAIIFNLSNGTISGTVVGFTPSIENAGNGWYRCSLSSAAMGGGSNLSYWIIARNANSTADYVGDGVSGILIWGAQLNEGALIPYQLTETRLNRPRVDFSLGGCPNLLLEPQRTNLNLWSEDLTNVYWSKFQSSVTANAATAPNGLLTADKIVEDSTNNAHSVFIGGLILTIGQSLTRSVYLKADGRNWVSLSILESSTFHRAYFNLSNGTIGNVGAGVTASISPAANGYYRCSITRVLTTTNPSSFAIELASADGTNIYLGNGVSGILAWGAQIEVGAYPTTYIPTTSASVTRNGDSFALSNVFTNNMISSAGGTWFVDLRNNRVLSSGGGEDVGGGFELGNSAGVPTNAWKFRRGGGAQRINIWNVIGGTSTPIYNLPTDNSKVAIKWNGTTADVFVNGVKVVTATSFPVTNMDFLRYIVNQFPTYLNSMALYNTPLSDAECIQITTL
jgi:hypothetical protein